MRTRAIIGVIVALAPPGAGVDVVTYELGDAVAVAAGPPSSSPGT